MQPEMAAFFVYTYSKNKKEPTSQLLYLPYNKGDEPKAHPPFVLYNRKFT